MNDEPRIPEHVEPSKPWPRPVRKIEWEELDPRTTRMKVHGGWIVRYVFETDGGSGFSGSMVFVPDSGHRWMAGPVPEGAPAPPEAPPTRTIEEK